MFSSLQSILSSHISPNDTLIVGVSGGPDSTALLALFKEFSETVACKIIVAHVNHGIRGSEALRDEKFVKKIAAGYKFRCHTKRMKLAAHSSSGLEERGREARRAFFEKLAEKESARWIITAHTADDQLETIIFNFIRGSGIRGLAGMKMTAGLYFKPLLGVEKKELLAYLRAKKLSYCIDATNTDTRFSRNLIRKKLLPLMRRLNPNIGKTLLNNREIFLELDASLTENARAILGNGASFPLKTYESLPAALQSALIQETYLSSRAGAKGKSNRLSSTKIREIRRLLSRRIGGKMIECPGRVAFGLKKGIVTLLQT